MIRKLLIFMALTGLAACAGTDRQPSFKSMTQQELALYNSTVAAEDMVLCIEDVRMGSHIRKKHCATLAEFAVALEANSAFIGTVNYGGTGGIGGGGFRGIGVD